MGRRRVIPAFFFYVSIVVVAAADKAAESVTSSSRIASNPACREDVARLCGSNQVVASSSSNDLSVLDCLQNSVNAGENSGDINKECHTVHQTFI